jgi:hypothetical protein
VPQHQGLTSRLTSPHCPQPLQSVVLLTAYTRLLTDGTTVLIGPARPRDGGIKAAPLLYGHLGSAAVDLESLADRVRGLRPEHGRRSLLHKRNGSALTALLARCWRCWRHYAKPAA